MANSTQISYLDNYAKIAFSAMASPCEVLVDSISPPLVEKIAQIAVAEAKRIEHKFSRYRNDNLCFAINNSQGKAVAIDAETYQLLCFAEQCFQLSDGLFDLSSGVLRRAWTFDTGNKVPTQAQVRKLLAWVGWRKITFDQQQIIVPKGMELDFGGIGKEYAVDLVAHKVSLIDSSTSVLVNFGGDICVSRPRADGRPWQIGIESTTKQGEAVATLSIHSGAIATSGDTQRYVVANGKRYSHIINPKTGWPEPSNIRTVTVAAQRCIQAGCLATLAMLAGEQAQEFLTAQQVQFWCH